MKCHVRIPQPTAAASIPCGLHAPKQLLLAWSLPCHVCRLQFATAGGSADAANMELLQAAAAAEVQKLAGKSADAKATSEIERDMTDQMVSSSWLGALRSLHLQRRCRRCSQCWRSTD